VRFSQNQAKAMYLLKKAGRLAIILEIITTNNFHELFPIV